MSKRTIVFVVGAGASCEVGLPSGKKLLGDIASAIDFRVEHGQKVRGGDDHIWNAMHLHAQKRGSRDINPYLHACRAIRNAMPQAESIDSFIDSRRGDELIAFCGKLAIARCISAAEEQCRLWIDPRNSYNTMRFSEIAETWYAALFRLLVQGASFADLPIRLARIAFVTFNYDRCIEHYLFSAIKNYFGVDDKMSSEALRSLATFHVYGHLGPLPWQGGNGPHTSFGGLLNPTHLIDTSGQLKTFTEGTDEGHSDILSIRQWIRDAERVTFLGFSFNPQNLQLLYGQPKDQAIGRKIFGTAHGLSESDVAEVTAQLIKLGNDGQSQFFLRQDLLCAGLFEEYKRSLDLH